MLNFLKLGEMIGNKQNIEEQRDECVAIATFVLRLIEFAHFTLFFIIIIYYYFINY